MYPVYKRSCAYYYVILSDAVSRIAKLYVLLDRIVVDMD